MKNKLVIILICIFFSVCAMPILPQLVYAAQVIKLAHENPPGGQIDQTFQLFAKTVGERTNGRYEVKVFPGGQLGDERAILEGVKVGTLDAGAGGLSAAIDPLFNLIYLPFLFRDVDHMHKVLDGPIGAELKNRALQRGYKIMGMYDGGFHHFLNNAHPIYGPDDLKGIKIRVMGVPPYIDGIKAYGANPVSIPYGELYTALQQGVIDAAEQNLDSINRMKFYEVVKYVSLAAWAGAVDVMFLSEKLWNSLSPDDQKVFEEAGKASVDFQRKLFKEGVDAGLGVILKAGVKVNLVYQPAFYKQAETVYKKYEKDVPLSLIERIRAVK